MCVLLFDVFNGCYFSSIKEIKRSKSKGILKIYYWKKLPFSKLVGKKIPRKENLKKCTSFEEQQGKPLALSLCDCNAKCRLLSVGY